MSVCTKLIVSSSSRLVCLAICFFLTLVFSSVIFAEQESADIFFREEFSTLDNWGSLTFPKIDRHSKYYASHFIEDKRQSNLPTVLLAESSASASALLHKQEYSVVEFPKLRWRWRVENVYEKGNAKLKSGDDFPIRIYVVFKYNPDKAGVWERGKYKAAKLIYGEYPPKSTLNYVWASKEHSEEVITSAYTDSAKLLPVDQGSREVGNWREHERDVLADYRKAFGENPPEKASIAIMTDADNTGEAARAWVDYIEIGR